MAAKPLSLKREKARRIPRAGKFAIVAQVLLGHDIAHLDQGFTYGIPDSLASQIEVGSIVRVSFNRSEIDAVVIEIGSDEGAFKPISKLVKVSAYSPQAIELATEVAKRYATSAIKILKYFDKNADQQESIALSSNPSPQRDFIPEGSKTFSELATRLSKKEGSVLLFAPSARECREAIAMLSISLGDRVISFDSWRKLQGNEKLGRVIVGMRGMIFLQAVDVTEMVIVDEASEHYWEKRSPFWNLRDVALLKSQMESISLTFISGSPSLELTRLGELGYLKVVKPIRQFIKRRRFANAPDTYHRTVRSGLQRGNVLVSVSSKNYINALTCKRCDAKPKCNCGFPLKIQSDKRAYCGICGVSTLELRCRECGSLEFSARAKGIERIKEEFAKAFPNVPIQMVTVEKEISNIPTHSIVIATPGVEPRITRYSGLVLLDGVSRTSRPTLRAEEHLANHWFRLLSLTTEDATVYVSLPIGNQISQALVTGNPYRFMGNLLKEREETKLPPFYRVIKVRGESLAALATKLSHEFSGIQVSKVAKQNELTIRAEVSIAQNVITALYSLAKYRAASGKGYLDLEIDPYDI